MAPKFADLFRSRLSTLDRMNILMVGLDGAGKTTILRHLDLGRIDTTVSAIESVEFGNLNLLVWDVGGAQITSQWRHYLEYTKAVIFVVDSSSNDRLADAKHQLHSILSEEKLQDVVVLVFANKNDYGNAMDATHISDMLDLQSIKQRHWHVKSTCAITGDGLIEGIDWLYHKLQHIKEGQIVGHVFHPNKSECISMLRVLRSSVDMGHDAVKPMNNLYEDDPRLLFGNMQPNIILKHQYCVSFTRSEAQGGGYIRKVTTGGHWKVNGSPIDISDVDKGVVVGEYRELTFVNTKGRPTCWKMMEFDTKPTTSALTICIVFNVDSEIFQIYTALEKALERENDERKDVVPPTVGESLRSGALKSKRQLKITQVRRTNHGHLRLNKRGGIDSFVSTNDAEDEEDLCHEVPDVIRSEEEELTAAVEAQAKQLDKGKQVAVDLLPPPQDRLQLSGGLSDSGIPVEVYVESLRTCKRNGMIQSRNGAESSSRSRNSASWIYETRSRAKEKKEITKDISNVESTVKALKDGLRWGSSGRRKNKTRASNNEEVDAAEVNSEAPHGEYGGIPKNKADRRVGLVYDERMCKHSHPGKQDLEIPERILAIWNRLKSARIPERCKLFEAEEVEEKYVKTVHSEKHARFIKTVSSTLRTAKRDDDRDVYFNKFSSESAYLAAGSVLMVAEKVAKEELDSAFAIVRPPGHHAEPDQHMGFCLINNVAVAAQYLLDQKELHINKILIVDWDVHHGNGTQNIFWKDPRVLFFSVHRYDKGTFYPSNDYGSHTKIGAGPGVGYNINVPWEKGECGDADYVAAWDQILIPVAREFKPDIVFISAGFDAAIGDPLGGCCVTPDGYSILLKKLMEFSSGKIIMALEGGYDLTSIANSALACVELLLDADKPVITESSTNALESTWRVIKAVREELSSYWPILADKLPESSTSSQA